MSKLLHELCLDTASRTPDAVALRHQGVSISYSELVAYIDAVASGFIERGVGRGGRIGIYLPKQTEAVVAMFAAARAGAVFVPINPVLKRAQVAYILRDCDVEVLITSAQRWTDIAEEVAQCPALRVVVLVDEPPADARVERWGQLVASARRPAHRVVDADVVSILYTSGSTGRPKGVVLSHKNMVTGALSVASYLQNRPDDRLLAVLPLSFDYGFSQLSTAFSVGASVALIDHQTPHDVVNMLASERITGLAGVPPLWIQLAEVDWPAESVASLRYMTNSGGAMPRATLDVLRAKAPSAQVFLMYGLTEAFRSTYLPPSEIDRRPDSIGKAIPNVEVMVVRPDGTECDADEPGELVHRGPLVGLGYWGDRERTAERYKPIAPLMPGLVIPELAVWSGDTVRRDAEGFLYFVGRRDEMIKVSGYRISPTEIEEAVVATGLVADAVATGVPYAPLGQAIVVIASPARGRTADTDGLQRALADALPAHMVPFAIEWRDALPRNPNGKFDRPRLANEAKQLAVFGAGDADAPSLSPEQARARILSIWRDVLGERHDGRDEFFAVNGHSLLAIRILARVEHELGVRVPLRAFFARATAHDLADEVIRLRATHAAGTARPVLQPTARRRAPLLPPQRGTYRIDAAARTNRLNRLIKSMWIDGALDERALELAVDALRARHAILRTRFFEEDGALWQETVDAPTIVPLHREDLSSLDAAERDRADASVHEVLLRRPFDLAHAEVFRVLLVTHTPTRHRLTLVLHRLVSDQQSLQIFDDELVELWSAFTTDRATAAARLPPPSLQYLDLVDYLERLAHSSVGEQQRAFWQRKLAGAIPLVLPGDELAPPATGGGPRTSPIAWLSTALDTTQTQAVEDTARYYGASVMSVLLAVMAMHLNSLTGQEDLALVSHLLYRHIPGLERTMGLFANPLVVRVATDRATSFEDLVARAHETVTSAFDNGEFDVAATAPHLFRVFFNYLYPSDGSAPPSLPPGLSRTPAEIPGAHAEESLYDLIVSITHTAGRIDLQLGYRLSLLPAQRAEQLLHGYADAITLVCAPRTS